MTDIQQPTLPRTPGPEMAALERFYTDVTWTGTIEPNGMGPGSPAMTARGRGVHSRLHDGLWIVGDYRQDQFLTDGTFVLTWRLHWVTGWDTDAGQYRATLNDNYGHADVMHGRIDGDRLIYATPDGRPVRLRLTWDLTDPASAGPGRNEVCLGGGDRAGNWSSRYRMRPALAEPVIRWLSACTFLVSSPIGMISERDVFAVAAGGDLEREQCGPSCRST